jgi:AAA+ superfamily predicted ATPase
MSDQVSWAEGNARYLSAALAWLRLRLERYAQRTGTGQPQESPVQVSSPSQDEPVDALDPEATGVILAMKRPAKDAGAQPQDELAQKAAEMATAESQMAQPPALVVLSRRLGLSRFERDVQLLCIALELDTRIAALCAHAQDDLNKPYPTFALALTLFDTPSWDILSPERPLRHWRLIEINQPGAQSLTTSPLRADERIVNYVKGLNYLDDRLSSFVAPFEVDGGGGQMVLPPSHQALVKQIKLYWRQAWRTATPTPLQPIVQLVGADIQSKQLVANRGAAELNRQLYRLPVELLPTQAADLEMLIRLFERESRLQQLALYLDAQELDSSNEAQAVPLSRFLTRSDGMFFLSTRETWSRLSRLHLILDVAKPTSAEQQGAWTAVLGSAANVGADLSRPPSLLSSQFDLSIPTILRIAQAALDQTADDGSTLPDQLWDACKTSVRPRLDTLAQRLEPKVSWDDLILPEEETRMLHQIADQVMQRSKVYEEWGFASKMNRGLGINALFAGESGTGKTMAAEVLANALRLNLYRIDLSAVVSKYIGETEKNLRRLFDAAEDGGAILFFDEADALFGKRSEVKDSHDRYANIEINYLLQRMEAYRGLAILATNMKNALDTAFTRRLRFSITFPFPGFPERKQMWQKVFPASTPTERLDYDRLARFNLTGGSIHNIALNAAFLAAQAETPVTMPHILAAARAEFRKMERPVNETEFRWQAPATSEVKE